MLKQADQTLLLLHLVKTLLAIIKIADFGPSLKYPFAIEKQVNPQSLHSV